MTKKGEKDLFKASSLLSKQKGAMKQKHYKKNLQVLEPWQGTFQHVKESLGLGKKTSLP